MGRNVRKLKKAFVKMSDLIKDKSSPRVNIGFVGCGVHARQSLYPCLRHLPFNLTAICAKHLENAQRTAKLFGAERAYNDYEKMFEKEKIEAVLVSVGPKLHYEITLKAMEKGLHVFVEKPPAESSKQTLKMLELSQKTSRHLMVGFNRRFAPTFVEVKRIIESSSFKKPHLLLANFFVGETKSEWDLILDVGIHYFDLARFFFGEVENISAVKVEKGNFSTLVATLRFVGGKIGVISLSNRYLWAKPSERVTVLGDECQVSVDNLHRLVFSKATVASPGRVSRESEKTTLWQPNYSVGVEENQLFFLNGYAYELMHFYRVIKGKEKLCSGICDGHEALKIAEEIKRVFLR